MRCHYRYGDGVQDRSNYDKLLLASRHENHVMHMHPMVLKFIGYDDGTSINKFRTTIYDFSSLGLRLNYVNMETQAITSFMGSEIGTIDDRVTKAMNASSTTKLSIHQFITATEFKIDPIMVNYFWQVVAKNQGVHMHPLVLKFIGYDSVNDKLNKRKTFI